MFTLDDINKAIHRPTASFNFFLNPIILRATWFFVNYTKFSPNFITLLSFIFVIACAYFFLKELFILGSICFFIRYVLDHVDGQIARLKNKASKFGTYFDNISGYLGTAMCTIALVYPLNPTIIVFLIPLVILMSFIHPLQTIIVLLFIKKMRQRIYKETFGFEDLRLVTFVLVPIIPYFIKLEFSLFPILFLTIFFFFIKQIGWMIYYYKEFKEIIV